MRIGNFNVAGIARSNFEPGVNINESLAVISIIALNFLPIITIKIQKINTTDVVNVCYGVNVSVMNLNKGGSIKNNGGTRGDKGCGKVVGRDGGGGGGGGCGGGGGGGVLVKKNLFART